MKVTASLLLVGMFLFVNTSFAQMSRTLPVSLTLTGDRITSFEVYPDATSTTSLTELALSSGGHTINDNVKYVAGDLYIDITPGNTGVWYLLIYTSNDVPANGFSHDQRSQLLATDGSYASLVWKYNNPLRFVAEQGAVASEISDDEWNGAYSGDYSDPMYLFMLNIPPGQTPAEAELEYPDLQTIEDVLIWASLVHYKMSMDAYIFENRTRITFGVDLKSSCRATTYETNLNIEVYYE